MNIKDCYIALGADFDYAILHLLTKERIRKYAVKYAEGNWCAKVKEAYKEKNYSEVYELAHDIKGMASTLGLTVLYERSDEVCKALHKEEAIIDCDEQIEALIEECVKTRELLSISE